MTQYLISFDDGTMIIPEEEMVSVGIAARKVMQEAKDAGAWVFACGLIGQPASAVGTDGTVSQRPYPDTKSVVGGFQSSGCRRTRKR